jgi:hypothetical protein
MIAKKEETETDGLRTLTPECVRTRKGKNTATVPDNKSANSMDLNARSGFIEKKGTLGQMQLRYTSPI